MSRVKFSLTALSELTPEQFADCFAQLIEKTHGTTREGKPFYTCRFSDNRRTVTVMIWADSPHFGVCEETWEPGLFFKMRGRFVQHEKYGPQFDLEQIRPVQDGDREHGFDPALLVERSRFDSPKMFTELTALVEKEVADEPLRRLVLLLLERNAEWFTRLPATQNRFYPFAGGLLEHTLSVTHTCLMLADYYLAFYPELNPPLNRDVVVAGAVLHDLGRVLELGGDTLGKQPTIPGRLIGPLMLGRDMVRDAAFELGDVNPELVQLLEHLLVAHLALPEWGSPRLPMIPECLILHHADDLDAKLEMFVRCLTRDKSPGAFTDREPTLNRPLLKGRTV